LSVLSGQHKGNPYRGEGRRNHPPYGIHTIPW